MRRLIIVTLLLASLYSEGQIINASPAYRPTLAVSCSYILDQYPNAAAAYSLRKLDCDYTGYAIRVRRSSDNSEQDIGFTTGGDLDTSSLKTFVSTNSGYIVTWYDQSGNGLNVTQGTSGNQPVIVTSGTVERQGSKPAIKFTAANSNYLSGGDVLDNDSSILNIYAVSKLSSAATQTIISKSNGDVAPNKWTLFKLSGNGYAWYVDSYTNRSAYASFSSTSNTLFQYYSNKLSDSVQIITNGSQLAVNTAGISDAAWNTAYNLYVGAYNGSGGTVPIAGFYHDGTIQEIILYKKAIDRSAINSSINNYYSIY